jgi:hypothetical protein
VTEHTRDIRLRGDGELGVTREMVGWLDRALRSGLMWEIDHNNGPATPYAMKCALEALLDAAEGT